jgi:hypothetical protein
MPVSAPQQLSEGKITPVTFDAPEITVAPLPLSSAKIPPVFSQLPFRATEIFARMAASPVPPERNMTPPIATAQTATSDLEDMPVQSTAVAQSQVAAPLPFRAPQIPGHPIPIAEIPADASPEPSFQAAPLPPPDPMMQPPFRAPESSANPIPIAGTPVAALRDLPSQRTQLPPMKCHAAPATPQDILPQATPVPAPAHRQKPAPVPETPAVAIPEPTDSGIPLPAEILVPPPTRPTRRMARPLQTPPVALPESPAVPLPSAPQPPAGQPRQAVEFAPLPRQFTPQPESQPFAVTGAAPTAAAPEPVPPRIQPEPLGAPPRSSVPFFPPDPQPATAAPGELAFAARVVPVAPGTPAQPVIASSPPVLTEAAPALPKQPVAAAQPRARRPEKTASVVEEQLSAPTEPSPGRWQPAPSAPAAAPARETSQPEIPAPARVQEAAAPAQPVIAPAAAKHIQLQFTGGQGSVQVHLVQRGGEVQVAVHTPDAHLAGALREELPALSSKLEQSGFHAETWHGPAAGPGDASRELFAGASRQDLPDSPSGNRDGRHHEQQQPRQQQPPEESAAAQPGQPDFSWLFGSLQ